MHYAAANTNPDILKFLLANGPDPNDLDLWRRTPLMIAAELGRLGNIQVFLEEFEKRKKGSGSKSDQSENEEEENGSEEEYGIEEDAAEKYKIDVDFVN